MASDLSKFERYERQLEEASREARRASGLVERRCPNPSCNGVMGEYEAPIKRYRQKCRHCGLYSELSTEQNGQS